MLTVRDFLMPDLGEGLTEGEINRWLVAEGDVVVVDQPIAEITTEKAVVEVPTPFAGRVATLHGVEGESIAVGTPLISIEVAGGPSESASGNVLVGYGTSESAPRARRSGTSPVSDGARRPRNRRTAGITAGAPSRGGDGHRPRDYRGERAGRHGDAGGPRARRAVGAPKSASATPASAGGVRTPLTGVDRIAAERLTRSYREAPTATATLTADATRIMEWRSEPLGGSGGVRITPFAVILRLCAVALGKFPRLNAHFDAASQRGRDLRAGPSRCRGADGSRPGGRGDPQRARPSRSPTSRRSCSDSRPPRATARSMRRTYAAAPSPSPTSARSVSMEGPRSSIPRRQRSSVWAGLRHVRGSWRTRWCHARLSSFHWCSTTVSRTEASPAASFATSRISSKHPDEPLNDD